MKTCKQTKGPSQKSLRVFQWLELWGRTQDGAEQAAQMKWEKRKRAAAWAPSTLCRTLDFNGLELGSLVTPRQVYNVIGGSCAEGYAESLICQGTTSIPDRGSADVILTIDRCGSISRIEVIFSSNHFQAVKDHLAAKFGAPPGRFPATDSGPSKMSMSQKDTEAVYFWESADRTQARLMVFAPRRDFSQLVFSIEAHRNLVANRRQEREGALLRR